MPDAVEAFTNRLLAALPGLRSRFEETAAQCRAEGSGEAAPYELVDGLTRELLARYHADPAAGRAPLADLARVLEDEYRSDPDVTSLVDACFLALFPPASQPDPADLLGPELAARLAEQRGWRARPADVALVDRLVAAVPALEPLVRENTYGDHDDVLVHRFLGDVVGRLTDEVAAERLDEARAVVAVLEDAWGGDSDEAIAASFVENLPWPHEAGAGLVTLLGPRLRAELDRQRTR